MSVLVEYLEQVLMGVFSGFDKEVGQVESNRMRSVLVNQKFRFPRDVEQD